MDPNAALATWRDRSNVPRRRQAARALRDWLVCGGFEPAWESPEERKRFFFYAERSCL